MLSSLAEKLTQGRSFDRVLEHIRPGVHIVSIDWHQQRTESAHVAEIRHRAEQLAPLKKQEAVVKR